MSIFRDEEHKLSGYTAPSSKVQDTQKHKEPKDTVRYREKKILLRQRIRHQGGTGFCNCNPRSLRDNEGKAFNIFSITLGTVAWFQTEQEAGDSAGDILLYS